MIQTICIVRLSALGDVLMLVPLVRSLQAHFPQALLTWIISRPAYELVKGMDNVEFIVINKPQNVRDYWRFRQSIRLRKFDVLLATQASFRANLLYPFIKATRKIGYDKLRAKDGHRWFVNETIMPGHDHTLESFLKFATSLGVNKNVIQWNLPIEMQHQQWAKTQLNEKKRPIIIVNPAASKPERSWLVERYIAIIKYAVMNWGANVILTGGPTAYDESLAHQIMAVVHVTNLVGKTQPKQLLALIQQSDLVLCPDTGPSHMASAVSTPVIALHAVTSSKVSGPYLFRHLAIDHYSEAVKKILQISFEENKWGTHVHSQEAMSLISVNEVKQRMDMVLHSLGFTPIA